MNPKPKTRNSKPKTQNSIALARDTRRGGIITLDLSRPRCIFITGKRGSGKTRTLHRLAAQAAEHGATIIAIDPLGALLELVPNAHRLVPGDNLKLNPSDLTTDAWLALFGLGLSKPGGILLSRALRYTRRSNERYLIPEMIGQVEEDDRANDSTKDAIANRLEAAYHDWGIFRQSGYEDLTEIFTPGLHIVDLSGLEPGPNSLRNLVAFLLVSRLFARVQTAKNSKLKTQNLILLIDEAHNFVGSALAAKPVQRWAREGRNFGLTLVLATQRPSAIPADTLSQADILVIHRLTLVADVKAVGNLASSYARDLAAILKGVREPGQAIIVDDAEERAVVGRVILEKAK
jgi:DNA helicase HerA-like ATPase